MTAVLTATPDLTNSPPRMVLNLSGFSGTSVVVTRTDVAGNAVTVRAANPANLSGGGAVIFDYEAPYAKQLTWTAVSNTGATTTASATATLPATQSWLIHPGIPSLSVPIIVGGMGDLASDVAQGVHRPLGRSTPIVISTGKRFAPTFDLQVHTGSQADEDALWTLLGDASTLLLQIAYDPAIVTRSYYYWVSIGQVTRGALSPFIRPDMGGDDFMWTLPCTVASRPSGALQQQQTWADVAAQFPTWRDVASAYSTWRDLILGNESSGASPLVTGGETWVDNGDGTLTVTGATDNGDGTLTIVENDNGDGTVTVG